MDSTPFIGSIMIIHWVCRIYSTMKIMFYIKMYIQVNLCKVFIAIYMYVHSPGVSSDTIHVYISYKHDKPPSTRTHLSPHESGNSISAIIYFDNV